MMPACTSRCIAHSKSAASHSVTATILLLLLALAGCNRSSTSAGPRCPLKVVCTTGQVADMIRNLGGKHVEVEALMGPTVDPHLYKATLADTRKLDAADIVFYNGLHLEGRLAEILENRAGRSTTIAVSDNIRLNAPKRLRKLGDGEELYDPHIWFDVQLWADCAAFAVQGLIEVDPAHKADYQRNADAYVAELRKLHAECKSALAAIPEAQRVLVTAHDAFGYFGQAYQVEVHGLQGVSTVDEAAPTHINDLVNLLVERKVKAIFVESSVPDKNIEVVIEGCRKRGHTVVKGGNLYSDALGSQDSPEATYIGMVKYNVRTIVDALKD